MIKAAYLYNFAMFVEWPRDAFASPDAPLVIGIVGATRSGRRSTSAVENKRINKRRIVVERVQSQQDLRHCQILFIAASERARIGELSQRLQSQPILIVDDAPEPGKRAGAVEFVVDDNKVGFEINLDAARARPADHQFEDAWPRQDRPLIGRRAFMTFFTHASIKRKLMLITTVTSSLALLLASAGFLLYDLTAFRARMSHDLMTQAEIISANSMAALAFQDERTVSEILAALRAKDEIVAAAIYTPDGRLFAVYRRDPQRRTVLPSRPEAAGYRFDDERAARLSRHRPARAIARHALYRVGHAAVVRAAAELHRHRRHSDARCGARRVPAVVAAAAGDLGADSGPRADHEDGVCDEERSRCASPRRRTTKSAR